MAVQLYVSAHLGRYYTLSRRNAATTVAVIILVSEYTLLHSVCGQTGHTGGHLCEDSRAEMMGKANKKPEMSIILGCLRGLCSYLVNFSQSVAEGE